MKRKQRIKAFTGSTLAKRRRGCQQHHSATANATSGNISFSKPTGGGLFTTIAQAYADMLTIRTALPAMRKAGIPLPIVRGMAASIAANKAAVNELIAAAISGNCDEAATHLPGFTAKQLDIAYEHTGARPPVVMLGNDIPLGGLLAAGEPLPTRLRGAIVQVCRKKQITAEDAAYVGKLYARYTNKERRQGQ